MTKSHMDAQTTVVMKPLASPERDENAHSLRNPIYFQSRKPEDGRMACEGSQAREILLKPFRLPPTVAMRAPCHDGSEEAMLYDTVVLER